MDTLFEAPTLCRLDVGVLIISVVLDLVGIATEADHEHINSARCALRCGRDDVVHIKMADALYDPPDVLAAA